MELRDLLSLADLRMRSFCEVSFWDVEGTELTGDWDKTYLVTYQLIGFRKLAGLWLANDVILPIPRLEFAYVSAWLVTHLYRLCVYLVVDEDILQSIQQSCQLYVEPESFESRTLAELSV